MCECLPYGFLLKNEHGEPLRVVTRFAVHNMKKPPIPVIKVHWEDRDMEGYYTVEAFDAMFNIADLVKTLMDKQYKEMSDSELTFLENLRRARII